VSFALLSDSHRPVIPPTAPFSPSLRSHNFTRPQILLHPARTPRLSFSSCPFPRSFFCPDYRAAAEWSKTPANQPSSPCSTTVGSWPSGLRTFDNAASKIRRSRGSYRASIMFFQPQPGPPWFQFALMETVFFFHSEANSRFGHDRPQIRL